MIAYSSCFQMELTWGVPRACIRVYRNKYGFLQIIQRKAENSCYALPVPNGAMVSPLAGIGAWGSLISPNSFS
jgi:hypothetical protein